MNETPHEEAAGPPDGGRPPYQMRLRSRWAPVTRLSRKVLLGLGTVAAIGIGGGLFLALRPQHQTTGSELYNTSNRRPLMALPICRATIPACRKPHPSWGRRFPATSAGRPPTQALRPPGMPTPVVGPTQEQQRIAQEQEAARTSNLFATTNVGQAGPCGRPGVRWRPGSRASRRQLR